MPEIRDIGKNMTNKCQQNDKNMTQRMTKKWQKHDKSNNQKMTKIKIQQPSEFAGKIFIKLLATPEILQEGIHELFKITWGF